MTVAKKPATKPNKRDAKAPEKAEKKTRKKREPDAPKKPMSAFFWYQQARRADLKKEKPELGHKEVIVVSSQLINPSIPQKHINLLDS